MTEYEFLEAENDWNLNKLESALEAEKGDKLTPTAKKYLRGVLCGYIPQEIGEKCQVEKKAVEVTLSREVSPYIKKLLKLGERERINWSRVPHQLAKEGYKLEFLSSYSLTDSQPQELASTVSKYKDPNFLGREKDIVSSRISNIDKLVQEVRYLIQPLIQEQCSNIKILDMSQPIWLDDLYIDIKILEKIPGRKRLEISESLHNDDDKVDGFKAVQDYSKLMVFGKPGAGKTTFLKKLAIKCIDGKFQANKVPFFITLKEWCESQEAEDLLNFIRYEFLYSEFSVQRIEELFRAGRVLLLLDGLDEVAEEYVHKIFKNLKKIFIRYHSNNFVFTCRIAAREYTFEAFKEVAIADFDDNQIEIFVDKFFSRINPELYDKFMEQLEEIDRLKELAKSPILLTFLCLEFEDNGTFTNERAELYKRVTRILLKKWDEKRDINRSNIFNRLNIHTKENFLSYVAFNTFTRNLSSFREIDIQEYIYDYIKTLPNNPVNSEFLQLDIEDIIKSIEEENGLIIEIGRGIYSFSHRTFHEYFTARYIVDNFCQSFLSDIHSLQNIAQYITNSNWREVILLTVSLLENAKNLLMLMKKEIDLLIYSNKWLDNFLIWLNIKSESAYLTNDKKAAIRAFYFDLACRPHLFYIIEDVVPSSFTESLKKYYNFLFLNIEPEFNILRHIQTALDVRLIKIIGSLSQDFVSNLDLDEAIEFSNIINCIDELHELLQNIKKIKNQYNNELKDSVHQIIKFQKYVWLEKLNSLLIKYRNIDYNLQFTQEQCKLLETYYNSNLLLVECLNTDSKVSPEVRSHIEDTLLLPIEEIEKRPFKN